VLPSAAVAQGPVEPLNGDLRSHQQSAGLVRGQGLKHGHFVVLAPSGSWSAELTGSDLYLFHRFRRVRPGNNVDVQDLPTTRLDTNDYWNLLSVQRPMTGFIGVRGEGLAA
jgi:hypothetical protein